MAVEPSLICVETRLTGEKGICLTLGISTFWVGDEPHRLAPVLLLVTGRLQSLAGEHYRRFRVNRARAWASTALRSVTMGRGFTAFQSSN